jgi:hypothetical protein
MITYSNRKLIPKGRIKMTFRYLAFLSTLVVCLFSSGVSAYSDFSSQNANKSVVTAQVSGLVGSTVEINAVALTKNLLLIPTKSVSRVGLKLTIAGENATVIDTFKSEQLTLLSYPTGGLTPVSLAKDLGEPKRNLHVVNLEDDALSGTILEPLTEEPGVISMSMSTALISYTGSAVFNNCGELIGIYDETLGKKLAKAISLTQLNNVVEGIDGLVYSATECPSELYKRASENERRMMQLKKIEAEAAAKQKAADDALKAARAKMSEQDALNKKALAEAEKDSLDTLEEAKAALTKEMAEKQAESDKAVAELEATKLETEEALRKAKEEMLAAKLAEEKRNRLILGGSILAILLLSVIALIIRRSKSSHDLDIDDNLETDDTEALAFDVFIRGNDVGVKVPAELIVRARGVIIGRSATECDFVLDSPELSRSHIRLTQKDGILYLEDLGSANGSSLNGLKLQAGQLVALHHGDELELAVSMFLVEFRDR